MGEGWAHYQYKRAKIIVESVPVLFCSVLFSAATLQVLIGVVSSHIGDMYVCVCVVDSPRRQEEAMNIRRQSLSSFR